MKITVVGSTHENIAELNALVSGAFGYKAPHTFLDDFPVWGSDIPEVVRLGIYENSELVSHVGIRYTELKTANGTTTVALIGAVATESRFRGKGFSTALLTEALRQIDERKCEWTLLWGSEHAFYGKFGFHLQGQQGRAPISKFSLPKGVRLTPTIKIGMTDKIFQTLLSETRGVKLCEADRPWVFAHKTIQWLSIESPFAFVAFERGMDLKHMIHEMGGNDDGIKALFYDVYAHDPLAEVMASPEQLIKLGFSTDDLVREFLCLARPHKKGEHWNEAFWVPGISAC